VPAGGTALTGRLRAAVDVLAAVDPDGLSDDELVEAMVELRRQQARLAAATTRLTAAFDTRRVWAGDGSRSAGSWLGHRCRLPGAQMRAEVRLGRRLGHMPATADAFAAGHVAEAHASRLAPLSVGRTGEPFTRDEAMLVGYAKNLSWPEFCRAVEYWRQCADPDGAEQDAATDDAARRVDLWEGRRGTGLLSATLTPMARLALQTALRRIEQQLWQADWAQAKDRYGPDATPAHITRTAGQRRHDALVELIARATTAPTGGKRPRPLISVLVGYETFAGRVCELADGTVITPGVVASMLSEADIERVVFDSQRRIIDLGRRRSFTGAARRALEITHRYCAHPGCDVPAEACQGDHIQPWSQGGTTHPDKRPTRLQPPQPLAMEPPQRPRPTGVTAAAAGPTGRSSPGRRRAPRGGGSRSTSCPDPRR